MITLTTITLATNIKRLTKYRCPRIKTSHHLLRCPHTRPTMIATTIRARRPMVTIMEALGGRRVNWFWR